MQMKFPLLVALFGLLSTVSVRAESDAPSESVKAWKARLAAHINSNKYFPAAGLGLDGNAKVQFVMDRSGRLISRALAESTGSQALDEAALTIVARAEPFPEPPAELKGDSFSFTVPINFSPRRFGGAPLRLVLSGPEPALRDSDPVSVWRRGITDHVWRRRVFPPEAVGQTGDAGVTFVIDRSGKLISNALVESTGFAPLDAAALAMIERSAPFPKPPSEAQDDLQRLTILMTFDGTRLSPWPSPEQEKFLKSWTEEQSKLSTKFPGPSDAKMNSMLRSICRGC